MKVTTYYPDGMRLITIWSRLSSGWTPIGSYVAPTQRPR